MASQNIARLGVVLGLDTAEFTASIDKAISENAKLKNAIRRDTNSAAGELKALVHATEDYGKTLTKVELIQREVTSGKFMNATKDMKDRLLQQAAAYDKIADSAKNAAGATFKMNEQQKINLTYQTTDFFTQIASGQSPFIAALQQGGQLKDTMGGVGNMFRAIGSLFTPFSVGLGTVSIALGSLGYALYKAIDDLDKFKDAMTLTGGFAGVTYESLLNLGDVLSNKTNASIGSARDLMQQLAASGKYTSTSMEAVGEVILRFSKIAGVDAAKAAETLIPLLDGTASSAKQLNDKYHFLTLEQYKNIEALEKQGKLQESAKMQATLLNESLQSTQRELGILEKAWQGVANFASQAWDAMLGLGREDGVARAKELEKKINDITQQIEDRRSKGMKTGSQEAALKAFQVELNAIVSKEMAALDAAEARAKAAEANQKGIKDYTGAGGAAKEKEIRLATAKAIANNQYLIDIESANERQKIELETDKEIREKRLEFDKRSAEEKRAFGGLLARQLDAEIYTLELKRDEKLRAIRTKNMLAEFADEERQRNEASAAFAAEDNRRAAMRTASQAQTRELEFQRESLDLKYQLIYATQTEQRLAQVSLEYARKRREAEASPERDFLMGELERQEELAKMFVVMQESARRTQQVFDSVFGNLSSAIDNFVKTGKLSMKDLARSIIQDLIAIQMKAMVLRFLGSAFANISAAGTYGTIPGSQQTNMLAAQDAGFLPRANGGPVSANGSYLVGERGPELFMPSGSGTIIPNNQMGNMGGQTNVTNNYINAIDVKSFEDRLLGSSNTIWAANQYANKNLSTNFGRT
jgi:lambda family phage tail tape measure protein